MAADPILTPSQREFLASARRGVLATIAPDGRPRLVPICFVLDDAPSTSNDPRSVLYSALDEKPKNVDEPRQLARVRDLLRDSRVSVLVDRWDEDWAQLVWLRCYGTASLLEPAGEGASEHRAAVTALRSKYPQYASHDLAGRPLIRVIVERATGWGADRPG